MPKSRPNSPSASPRDAQAADCTNQPCPLACKPISAIRVVSVTFESDHDLLKNNGADWRDTGARYPKPEWTIVNASSVGAPISHTMDQPVTVSVVVDVQPPNACPEPGTFSGVGPGNVRFDPVAFSYQPGHNPSLRLRSSGKLPKAVQQLKLTVQWSAVAASGTFTGTTSNYALLTMNKPILGGKQEDGVTLKRMVKSVELVQAIGSLKPHDIVAGLMKPLKFFTLERDPSVPQAYNHPSFYNNLGGAWPLGGDYPSAYGECQAIVRFVHGVIDQIGCPGDAEAVVVWADPAVNGGATVIESPYGSYTLHNRSRIVNSGRQYPALAATAQPLVVGQLYRKGSMMNMYEACLKFTDSGVTKYYGGGAGIYNNKDAVIKAFAGLVWYTPELQPNGNIMNRVQEIVHRY